jgi:predicted glycosyltransferase
MKVVVNMAHPAHVHYFKNLIIKLKRNGHNVLITAVDKEVLFDLLNKYGFNYIKVGEFRDSLIRKLIDIPLIDLKVYKAVRNFDPDIFIGFGSISASHVSFLMRKKSIIFEDSENAREIIMLYLPFANAICTSTSFNLDLGNKQVRYNGELKLAYLHPNYFKPNPKVLDELGLSEKDIIIIVRFVSWTASHDFGQHGIRNKTELVHRLERLGKVLISSEVELEDELEKYKISISPEKMHDLLYYATLYVGEGGTMAAESAVLGTHSIHISTEAKYCGVFSELNKYGLLWLYDDETEVIDKAKEILSSNPKIGGKRKRDKLFGDKIDVTAFMYWFIENYPASFEAMRENFSVQEMFRNEGFL